MKTKVTKTNRDETEGGTEKGELIKNKPKVTVLTATEGTNNKARKTKLVNTKELKKLNTNNNRNLIQRSHNFKTTKNSELENSKPWVQNRVTTCLTIHRMIADQLLTTS